MKKALIDVPVSMVFFNRPDTLLAVFNAVKEARPTKLFLIQDGAREDREDDKIMIERCRRIFDGIDWECDVVRIFSDVNLGCGERIYSGIKEVFSYVDRTVILEDDIVVSNTFFRYCRELLEKYKDDERIIDIAGMNHIGINNRCPNSYFFSEIGSCWGWATWKRSWDKMEFNMDFLEDKYSVECFMNTTTRTKRMKKKIIEESWEKKFILESGGKLSAWTHQFMMAGYLNSTLSVIPQRNLISNIGLTPDSGHAVDNINKIPKGLRRIFFAKRYEMNFPLKHPKYIIKDNKYEKAVLRILGLGLVRGSYRKAEGIIRQIIYGDGKKVFSRVMKRVKSKT